MFVGVCRLSLHIPGNSSLKGKRSVVRRVVERTRSKFNAAVAEVGDNDVLQRSIIGVTVVGNTGAHVDSMMSKISSFIGGISVAVVADRSTEVIPMGDNFGGDLDRPPLNDEFPWYGDDVSDSED